MLVIVYLRLCERSGFFTPSPRRSGFVREGAPCFRFASDGISDGCQISVIYGVLTPSIETLRFLKLEH